MAKAVPVRPPPGLPFSVIPAFAGMTIQIRMIDLARRRHFGLDLMLEHLGAPALLLIAVAAFLDRLVALARQFADALFALAQFAAAIAVGFVLAGRRPVGDLADGLHRRGHHGLHRADTAGEQGRGQCRNDYTAHFILLPTGRPIA
ncbi:membrane protein of unknown function [uncultured Sphingopyxis sp.]|uniref:Uncharacterized protein n=1 Tax=uncultured Sphingopyxis sp. TaxID=310581 RepID=A0A1Y5PV82_9SPHN|nr:membrane protein of unknown function [uncultured Sphingopyxis sp.]